MKSTTDKICPKSRESLCSSVVERATAVKNKMLFGLKTSRGRCFDYGRGLMFFLFFVFWEGGGVGGEEEAERERNAAGRGERRRRPFSLLLSTLPFSLSLSLPLPTHLHISSSRGSRRWYAPTSIFSFSLERFTFHCFFGYCTEGEKIQRKKEHTRESKVCSC